LRLAGSLCSPGPWSPRRGRSFKLRAQGTLNECTCQSAGLAAVGLDVANAHRLGEMVIQVGQRDAARVDIAAEGRCVAVRDFLADQVVEACAAAYELNRQSVAELEPAPV